MLRVLDSLGRSSPRRACSATTRAVGTRSSAPRLATGSKSRTAPPHRGRLPRVAGAAAARVYRVEAITKSDEPDEPGWAYFLELWTETGPARLHIEGELEESDDTFTVTLNGNLP